jgi:hypothetical protein
MNKNNHESKNTRRTQILAHVRPFHARSDESSSEAILRERQWARIETPVELEKMATNGEGKAYQEILS